MLGLDFALVALLYAQPPFLFLLLVTCLSRRALAWVASGQQRGLRKRLLGVRFFECATRGRLHGSFRYDTSALALFVLFIVYDVDFFFLFSETTAVDVWSVEQLALLGACFLLFAGGLLYDIRQSGALWGA